jgi:Ca2+-binding RTX toxin-like protein
MKRILTLVALIGIISALIYTNGGLSIFNFSNTAYAVGDLTVDWGIGTGDVGPIFTVSNAAPGDSESHTVTVVNGSPESRPVGIRGDKTIETGNLAQAMNIVISRDGIDVYGGTTGVKTLAQFFTESTLPNSVELSTLTPSESETYTIVVTFNQGAGNEFQNKDLTFNLIMGIAVDIPASCSGININGTQIFGTSGNDRLRGTNKNDLIISLEGNDTVDSGNGNDCIIDLSGTGTLDGGNGNDVIVGGIGATVIDGGNGNDTIRAGGGNDKISGGNDNDEILGEGGNDSIDAGNGNDTVLGGEDNDTLLGGNGNDQLNGENGSDKADGELGKDTCMAETKKACEL